MSDIRTISRPYARAIFSVAKDKNLVAQIQQDLFLLKELFARPEVKLYLGGYNGLAAEKAKKVFEVFSDVLSGVSGDYLLVLAKAKRLPLLGAIYEMYIDLRHESEGVIAASIQSAFDLSETEQNGLEKILREHFGAKKIQAEYIKNKTLIGGVVIRTKTSVIDCSVSGFLSELKDSLVKIA